MSTILIIIYYKFVLRTNFVTFTNVYII